MHVCGCTLYVQTVITINYDRQLLYRGRHSHLNKANHETGLLSRADLTFYFLPSSFFYFILVGLGQLSPFPTCSTMGLMLGTWPVYGGYDKVWLHWLSFVAGAWFCESASHMVAIIVILPNNYKGKIIFYLKIIFDIQDQFS